MEKEEQTKDSFIFSFTKKMLDDLNDMSGVVNGSNSDKFDPCIGDDRKIKDFDIPTLFFILDVAHRIYHSPEKALLEEVKTKSIFNRKKFCLAVNSIPHITTENSFF